MTSRHSYIVRVRVPGSVEHVPVVARDSREATDVAVTTVLSSGLMRGQRWDVDEVEVISLDEDLRET